MSSRIPLGLPSAGSCLSLLTTVANGVIGPSPSAVDSGPVLNFPVPKGTRQLTSKVPGEYSQQFSTSVTQLKYLEPGDYVLDNGKAALI